MIKEVRNGSCEKPISDSYPMQNPEVILYIQIRENQNFQIKKLFYIRPRVWVYQILMKESDIEKTVLSVHNGNYEILRMIFGLKNPPSIFQRAMTNVLREYIGKFCHVYDDDIINFSESLGDHRRISI